MTGWLAVAAILAVSLPVFHWTALVQWRMAGRRDRDAPPLWFWARFWFLFACCFARVVLAPVVRPLRNKTGWLIAAMFIVALGLRVYQFTSRPGSLTGIVEYDDGPYVSSALLLTRGILPYRDYIFVQPPGIALLLAPLAFLERLGWLSMPAVMAAGRVITAVISSLGVVLAGLLVRHRGAAAVVVTCGGLAVYTGSLQAAHTVLLEPWLALFVLAGAVALFDGDRVTGSKTRILAAGVLFGWSGVVEAWAIIPALIALALLATSWRRAGRFTAGMVAGFSPALGFAALAPAGFWRGVVGAQIGHRAHAVRVSDVFRISLMEGLHWARPWSAAAVILAGLTLAALIAVPLLLACLAGAYPSPLAAFALAGLVLTTAMFFVPSQFLYHFMGWEGVWVTLALGVSVTAFTRAAGDLLPAAHSRWPGHLAAGLAVPLLAAFTVLQAAAITSIRPAIVLSAAFSRIIRPGSCVVSDSAVPLVLLGRLPVTGGRCPVMLDPTGADLYLSGGLKADTGAWSVRSVASLWGRDLRDAGYVLVHHRAGFWRPSVAWTPPNHAYFSTHFRLVYTQKFYFTGPVPRFWERRPSVPTGSVWYRLYARVPGGQEKAR